MKSRPRTTMNRSVGRRGTTSAVTAMVLRHVTQQDCCQGSKWRAMGARGAMGLMGPMGRMGPMDPIGPIRPIGPIGPIRPISFDRDLPQQIEIGEHLPGAEGDARER